MRSALARGTKAALAALAMATAAAWAQTPASSQGSGQAGFGDHKPPMEQAFGREDAKGEWWNNPKTVEELKLTADQRKAMDAILMEHRKTLIDLKAGLEKAELGMEPLMGADQPNESQILAQIDKVAQARAELEKANARFLLGLRSKLTPEQWKQMHDVRANPGPSSSHGWNPGQVQNQGNRGAQRPGAQQQPGVQPPSGQPGEQPSGSQPSGQPGDPAPADQPGTGDEHP